MASGAEVRRLRPGLRVTAALLQRTPGARLQAMCRRCMVGRDVDLASPRLRPWREVELQEVFARVPFRCRRCGAHAHALRATRPAPGGDGLQVLLSIGTRRSING